MSEATQKNTQFNEDAVRSAIMVVAGTGGGYKGVSEVVIDLTLGGVPWEWVFGPILELPEPEPVISHGAWFRLLAEVAIAAPGGPVPAMGAWLAERGIAPLSLVFAGPRRTVTTQDAKGNVTGMTTPGGKEQEALLRLAEGIGLPVEQVHAIRRGYTLAPDGVFPVPPGLVAAADLELGPKDAFPEGAFTVDSLTLNGWLGEAIPEDVTYEYLHLFRCPNLKSIPGHRKGMGIEIKDCPNLKEFPSGLRLWNIGNVRFYDTPPNGFTVPEDMVMDGELWLPGASIGGDMKPMSVREWRDRYPDGFRR